MGCGAKGEGGDVCGETYTCAGCRADDRLATRVQDLENTVALLIYHTRRGLTDSEAIKELEDTISGTASGNAS